AVIPVGRAYLGARRVVGERQVEEVAQRSATWRNYFGPPAVNAVYGRVLSRFAESERRLFPGFAAMLLGLVGLGRREDGTSQSRNAARLAYGLGLLLAFDLSLGFNGLSYRTLYEYVLPFRGLRIPARMGVIVGFSLAILAGFGARRLASAAR